MKKIILIAAAALIFFFVIWQSFIRGALLIPSADRFVTSFYEQYNKGDFWYLYNVLSDQKVRNRMSPPQFQAMMRDSYQQLGPVQSRKKIKATGKYGKNGPYAELEYKVKRAKVESLEKFVLIRKKKDWFVFDYYIRAV